MLLCVMHSQHNVATSSVELVRIGLTYEEVKLRFPHGVSHPVRYGAQEWFSMRYWLNRHVGPQYEAWTWLINSVILFSNQDDAARFALVWS